MAAIRAVLVLLGILGFFAVGVPIQWLVARWVPRSAARIPLAFCRALLRLVRIRLEIEGQPAAGAPLLLAANHLSWIDIPALGAVAPFCFLARSDMGSWPLLGSFARVQGTVFVDRKRRRTIPPANHAMAARMAAGRPVLLFPEGTTTAGPLPGRFRSSHFAAARDLLAMSRAAGREDGHAAGHVLIQPVAIAYSSKVAAWVGDDDLVSHLWRVLRAPAIGCRISFGPPIRFAAGADRKLAAAATEAAVAGLLGAGSLVSAAPAPIASRPGALGLAAGTGTAV